MFADVHLAGRGATDRWLSDARLLMQEAMASVPDTRSAPASLAAIARGADVVPAESLGAGDGDRKSTRLNSSHVEISYAVFCLKKKKDQTSTLSARSRFVSSGLARAANAVMDSGSVT